MKPLFVAILFLFSCFLSKAQQPLCDLDILYVLQERVQAQRPTQDEIESRKIAWIASAISLTPAEAARFWPVYNECTQKLEDNMRTRHAALRQIRQLSRDKKTDEKSYAAQSKILIEGSAEEARLTAEAHDAYVAILGEVRTAKLYLAEEQFRGMLIQELRQSANGVVIKTR